MVRCLSRRHSLLTLGAACAASTTAASLGRAQARLPDKTVRILLGFTSGSGVDEIARAIAPQLERRIGRHVEVENKPGVAGAVPGELLMKGAKDGSLLAFMVSTTLAAKLTVKNFPFDPVKDITPITLAGTFQTALAVSTKIGVSAFAEYLWWLKEGDPQRRRLGYTGNAVFAEIFGKMVNQESKLKLESMAYRGSAPMVNDLKIGRIPAGIAGVPALMEYHRGGQLKILMTTGRARSPMMPDVPTAVELGYPNLELTEWFGFFASPGVPTPVLDEWNRQIRPVLGQPELVAQLRQLGVEAETSTREEAAARVAAQLTAWKARIESVGMKPTD
jgi:tripartite-type tricarboxylate transporter receptor subunit TctC